jgi:hypothetical protein
MDRSYERLSARLAGLGDEEFFWEPGPNCWTIHQLESGSWTYHYAIPDPHPAPLTTIGWQVVHVATTKLIYHEWAFGEARLTFPDLEIPHTAAGALEMLRQGQALLRQDLDDQGDAGLDQVVRRGASDHWPAWRIFLTMADHDALHGGAIGQLRDLYHWQNAQEV